jgi:hypothetical protein
MVGPAFNEYGEHWHSSNHQFGMFRAAAWLKATGHDVTFIDAALPPVLAGQHADGKARLKERFPGAPVVKEMVCGNGESPIRMTKLQRYYGKPISQVRAEMAKAPAPDEVWVGSGLTYHYETSWELVQLAKEMFPGVRVRMGGIYPTLCQDHVKGSGAESFIGEIDDAKNFWPDYSVAPYTVPFRVLKLNSGCTVSVACSFCAVKTYEPKFTYRKPLALEEYVEQEIKKGVRILKIWASQLLQPPQAFAETMDRLFMLQVKHGVRLKIYASEGIQPSLFTPDMAGRMVRAGFSHLTIPMESIDPDTLVKYNKPSGISDYHRSVVLAKEAGFSWVGAFIMAGTPQQDLDELVHAVVDCWYRRIAPVIMKYTIIPGTQDWDDPQNEWIWKGKDLTQLHGSLWPAARPDLTCLELEEVTAIARTGYTAWSKLPRGKDPYFTGKPEKTASRVNNLFHKWCEVYGLIKDGAYRSLACATPHAPCRGIDQVSPMSVGSSVGHASVSMAY